MAKAQRRPREGSEEEQLRRMVAELSLLQETAEILQNRLNTINAIIGELTLTTFTLEELKTKEKESEILVHIGGGSYIKARIEDVEKAIVGLGANIAVEKSVDEAIEYTSSRVEELQKLFISTNQQLTQIKDKISQTQAQMKPLVEGLQRKREQG